MQGVFGSCGSNVCSLYDSSYFFSLNAPISVTNNNSVGTVSVANTYYVSLDITVNGLISQDSVLTNIFHVGNEEFERAPDIWFYPSSTRLAIRLGDKTDTNLTLIHLIG